MPEIRDRDLCGNNVLVFSSSHEPCQDVPRQCNIAMRQRDVGVSQHELESLHCLLYKHESVSSLLGTSLCLYLPQKAFVRSK